MPSLKFRIYQLNLGNSYDYYTFILEKPKPNESFIALGIVDVKELLQKNSCRNWTLKEKRKMRNSSPCGGTLILASPR